MFSVVQRLAVYLYYDEDEKDRTISGWFIVIKFEAKIDILL